MDLEERVPPIEETRVLIKPDHFLALAHHCQREGNNIGAIQNYITYMDNLDDHNNMKVLEQMNLTKLIITLSEIGDSLGNIEEEILKCYIGMLNNFPNNVLILNAFSVFLCNRGEYNVARGYLERAAREGYLPAEKNLLHALWHLVPRWHFRMLNDRKRNEAYRSAIYKAIDLGYKNIYDIGAGCGLLTLLAATHSADVKVTAFEENKSLYCTADQIFKGYDFENITLLFKNSNQVAEPPAPCNLIVTEIFDASFFGEHCLDSIRHALDCFVSKDFKIVPSGGRLYVTAVESEQLAKKFKYTGGVQGLRLEEICLTDVDNEFYDTEFLKHHKSVRYLSETNIFLHVNFYDKAQLEVLALDGNNCMPEVSLVAVQAGTVHAFVVWFELNLDDEIVINTSPLNGSVDSWEQAVFYVAHPFRVEKGDVVKIKPQLVEGQIRFSILEQKSCHNCLKASRDVITFLNDDSLVEKIVYSADAVLNHDIRVVDFNVFPLFGLLMAKRGATVYHVYKNDCDLALIEYLIELNKLSSQKFILIEEKAVERYMVYLESPHIVFTDFVKSDGSWNQIELSLETEAKLNCLTLPKKIFLKAQLIYSSFLDIHNKVSDSNVFDFDMGQHMNVFSGSEHPNIDHLECERLSTVVTFDITDLDAVDFHAEVEILRNGVINGIFYWFDINYTDDERGWYSTLDSFYYKKVCTLIKATKAVTENETIMINVLRSDGYLKVYC